jgi:hypothetical protein
MWGCRNPTDAVIKISVTVRHTGKLSRQEPRDQGEGNLETIWCSHTLKAVNARSLGDCKLTLHKYQRAQFHTRLGLYLFLSRLLQQPCEIGTFVVMPNSAIMASLMLSICLTLEPDPQSCYLGHTDKVDIHRSGQKTKPNNKKVRSERGN